MAGLEAALEVALAHHCEAGPFDAGHLEADFEQQLEAAFFQVVLAVGHPDSEMQLEADFDRQHLEAALVNVPHLSEAASEAIFNRLEADFEAVFEAESLEDGWHF